MPLDRPVVCPVLIDRDAQLAELERVLLEVRAGQGQTVLIAGEAGIGKSRLSREVRHRAEQLGLTALVGCCFEPDHSLPYAPVLDLLRACLVDRRIGQMGREMTAAAPALIRLLPEAHALLPDPGPAPLLEPEHQRRQLFHGVARLLHDLAATRPLLVVLEDLHWSDDSSLDLVLFLARRLGCHRILLLCTYRSDEVHPGLAHFLAELDRERLASEITLSALDQPGVGRMLRAILGPQRPVDAMLIEVVHALTEGNPFFIEEVLRSVNVARVQGGGGTDSVLPIPRSIQDAVRRRTAQFGPVVREVLQLAAVVGRRFDFTLLQALTRREERVVLESLKELIAAQLIVEESAERFAFHHELMRQALYTQLLSRERRALHRRIAEVLERIHAGALDRHRADLAYHFFQAGDWLPALENARWAGEQAQALYAPRAAVEHFNRALAAATHLATTPRGPLYRARAQAFRMLGAFEQAQADCDTALELVRADGDRRTEWQLLLDSGLLWTSRDYSRAGEYYQRALELARALDDPAMLGHSLNRLGSWYVNVDQPLVARHYHEEALAIFERLTDRRGIAASLDLLGMASCCSGDLLGSMALYQRAAALLRELDDRSTLVLSLALLASSAGDGHFDPLVPEGAELTPAMTAGEEAQAMARAIEWRAGEAFACAQIGQSMGARGEYERALGAAREACRIAGEIEHRQWLAFGHEVLGRLYLDLLALPAARHHLEESVRFAREVGSLIWLRAASGALVATCVQQGDLDRAEAVLSLVPESATRPQSIWQRLMMSARVELALARSQPGRALRLVDEVYASLEPDEGGRRRVGPPHIGRLRAEALLALGFHAEAESVLQGELEAAHARNCLPFIWRLHAALARLYRATGRPIQAERELASARAAIEELAAQVPDTPLAELEGDSLQAHFRQAASALLLEPHSPQQPRSTSRLPSGLTYREIQVLRLLAAGRSNREIAGELFISVRTVEHHVGSIYTKIGARRRADAAIYALRQGVLPVDPPDR